MTVMGGYDKFIPMARRAKIACSIDSRLLARVERLREETGESRSALIGRALTKLTAEGEHDAEVRRYVAAYREQPENQVEVEAARRHTRRTLPRLPWNDR